MPKNYFFGKITGFPPLIYGYGKGYIEYDINEAENLN